MTRLSHLLEFEPFVEVHADFREAVLRHQDALVRGDVAASRAAIERFQADLLAHAEREETKILPVLEARGGWGRAGDPRFYRDEHDKLRAQIACAVRDTAALDASAPDFARRVALLIGAEQALLHLLEHHDDRETRCLYPDLLKVTTPAERREMLA